MKVVALAATGRSACPAIASTSPVPASPLTVPPTVYVLVVQVTAMLVTFPLPTVPLAFATVQVCEGEDGWVFTVTAYALPEAAALANENDVALAAIERSICPAVARTNPVPVSPLTVPPTRKRPVEQFTTTLVTLAPATVPEPPPTVQVCAGLVGCDTTVTA